MRGRVPSRMRRPEGITDSTRWLFAGLVLISLLLALPGSLSSGRIGVVALALGSSAVLAGAWVYTYFTERLPLWLDVVVATGIMGCALTGPEPPAVFPLAFAAVWFGALYGSTARSLVRCGLYLAGIAATFPLWKAVPGHVTTPDAVLLIASAPTMVLTVLVGRHLAMGLQAREQSLRRDAALAVLGSQLLAVTDVIAIRSLARRAATELCSATPGLRLLLAVRDGDTLRIEGAAGPFATVPTSLPNDALAPVTHSSRPLSATTLLDSAAGAVLEWESVRIDDDADAEWMLLGAPARLSPSTMLTVRSFVIMVTLALRNSGIHQELTVQARVDSLTGLANRSAFSSALASALALAVEPDRLHLLFVDLDDFKDVNDGLGHLAGDHVLTEVATRLRACTRVGDVCARLGGDEFAVILADTSPAEAGEIAERIVHRVSEPIPFGAGIARIGASVGITSARCANPAGGTTSNVTPTATEVRHYADVAMYAAKANGKGQIQWFDTSLLQPAVGP